MALRIALGAVFLAASANAFIGQTSLMTTRAAAPAIAHPEMVATAAPPKKVAKKVVVKKVAPKKVVAKKVVKKKAPAVSSAQAAAKKKAPAKAKEGPRPKVVVAKPGSAAARAAAKRRAIYERKQPSTKGNTRAFAYGLPGNFNILGGGELNFDPAGFLDGKSRLEVYRYREAELTHGRIGMLAAVGFIIQENFHPLFSGNGGTAAEQLSALPYWFWWMVGVPIIFAEKNRLQTAFPELTIATASDRRGIVKPGYVPGQIGFDPLNLAPKDPKRFREYQEKELAHARLGMIASLGFILQEYFSGATWSAVYA